MVFDSHIQALFALTRSRVSERHIREFAPRDPGYDNYVAIWTRILRTGEPPTKTTFDLSEVIGLTAGWGEPIAEHDPDRFRDFRRFTSAIAVSLIHSGNDPECVRPVNYLARDLIVDCDLTDAAHFRAVRRVFPTTRHFLMDRGQCEAPFFTFGALILAQMAGDFEEAVRCAAQLLEDEVSVRDQNDWCIEDSRFLLGLTAYDRLDDCWLRWGKSLSNPQQDDSLELVLNAFGAM